MDFAGKTRAGRAVLNWSREELAAESGLSVPGIGNIENGQATTVRSQNKILRAYHRMGVSFTENGVEQVENPVFIIKGETHEETYLQLLEDIFDNLKDEKSPELLIMYANDSVSSPAVNDMYRKIRKSSVVMRQLIAQGNTYIIGPLEEYRYIPKQYFINRVTLIYGDRIANVTSDVLKIVVRVDPVNAEIQKNTFNMLWSTLEQPTETTSDERF